ncbi:hypothetical protein RHGRI_033066 [Rhododendron griersonianum]|uniref:Uncharacterized protein n=1 Tax=Rhododendron griersonianum TaxID=479676 RepID=A0AAV6HZH9_9ERIC|nr:hypothetical protein RHGRI_033066 [Rhododendron griersonianum]
MAAADNEKPHAVLIPFPAQSHMKGLMKLAKLLHHKGFFITFVNTEFNQNRFIKTTGPDSLSALPDFQFKTIPDGLPPSDPDATQDVALLCGSIRRNFLTMFRNLLKELNDRSANSENPPVTCIVGDGVMPFTITAAQELGIPVAVFWTFPACGYMGFYQYRALLDKGYTPLTDARQQTNEYLETEIDWIPGMKNIRLKDLPNFFRTTDALNDDIFNLAMESAHKALEASACAIQTFDALEPAVLDALSSMFSHVYTIGPLQLLLNNVKDEEKDQLDSLGYSLWKEELGCLQWLDSKEPESVVYVNFGSVTVMSQQQLGGDTDTCEGPNGGREGEENEEEGYGVEGTGREGYGSTWIIFVEFGEIGECVAVKNLDVTS